MCIIHILYSFKSIKDINYTQYFIIYLKCWFSQGICENLSNWIQCIIFVFHIALCFHVPHTQAWAANIKPHANLRIGRCTKEQCVSCSSHAVNLPHASRDCAGNVWSRMTKAHTKGNAANICTHVHMCSYTFRIFQWIRFSIKRKESLDRIV